MSATEDFTEYQVGADSSNCIPSQASGLRKGGYVVIKGKPCKIVQMTSSKVGKHGHAKTQLVGIDIFDGKKYEIYCPSGHTLSVPIVDRDELEIIHMSHEGYFSLMTNKGEVKSDLKYDSICCGQAEEDIRKMVTECEDGDSYVCMAQVLKALDKEGVKEVRKVKVN